MTYAELDANPEAAIAAAIAGDVTGVSVQTSGSTGRPRHALIASSALRASAEASISRLGGAGQWLLALPADRIAGVQVLARSLLAGTTPLRMPSGSFTAAGFVDAARPMLAGASVPCFVSLVPTQVQRILADATAAQLLGEFAAVLIGGAAMSSAEMPRNGIATYGSTETSGGVIYDGIPLDGTEYHLDDEGRILISGPTIFDRYADGGEDETILTDGVRWLRMPDIGAIVHNKLEVIGRADDVIVSGGYKLDPGAVERALKDVADVSDAAVLGVPSDEWGTAVGALIVSATGYRPGRAELREALSGALPRFGVPRAIAFVDDLPRLEGGKLDRVTALEILSADESEGSL